MGFKFCCRRRDLVEWCDEFIDYEMKFSLSNQSWMSFWTLDTLMLNSPMCFSNLLVDVMLGKAVGVAGTEMLHGRGWREGEGGKEAGLRKT